MSESDLLDLLLGSIIVLVAVIGYWQGVVRGLLFLCGALIGSEMALWWSDDLGDKLADWLPVNADLGRFVASTILILSSTFILGAFLGAQIGRPAGGLRDRLAGVGAGLASAVIVIGLVIRYFFIHLEDRATDALAGARLASFLWERFDWLVLGVVGSGVVMLVLNWILGQAESEEVSIRSRQPGSSAWSQGRRSTSGMSAPPDPFPYGSPGQQLTTSNDRQPAYGVNDRFASPLPEEKDRATVTHGTENRGSADSSDREPSATEKTAQRSEERSTQQTMKPPRDELNETQYFFAPQHESVAETLTFSAEDESDRNESTGMCPNCGMLLRSGDAFCPDCGYPVEK